jgi:hypothetical protein
MVRFIPCSHTIPPEHHNLSQMNNNPQSDTAYFCRIRSKMCTSSSIRLSGHFPTHIAFLMFYGGALCYKPEGRCFDSRWGHVFFDWPNPSSRIMNLRSSQPLTEMSTRNFPAAKGRLARKAEKLTAVSRLSWTCGSLDVSQPYGPPRSITGIVLPF